MDQRNDTRLWDTLPPEVLEELDKWLRGTDVRLDLRSWFDAGRSSGPVGLVRWDDPLDSRFLVLKFCDVEPDERIRSFRRAWTQATPQFRVRHLAEVVGEPLVLGPWRGVFMRVVGGDLEYCEPLTSLRERADFPQLCRQISDSIVRDWNVDWPKGQRPKEWTPGVLIRQIMGRRIGAAQQWARQAGISLTAPDPLVRPGWSEPLVNPFRLVTSDLADRPLRDLLTGRAHGDLSGRNILLPTRPKVAATSYTLIDFDRYADDAPLARDPMHLLVALTLDRIDDFAVNSSARHDLIRVIVDPQARPSARVESTRQLSEALWNSAATLLRGKGFGDAWVVQCLLSLVGVGLLHVGREPRTRNPDADRAWCLDLAAWAATEYLRRAGVGPAIPLAGTQTGPPADVGISGGRPTHEPPTNRISVPASDQATPGTPPARPAVPPVAVAPGTAQSKEPRPSVGPWWLIASAGAAAVLLMAGLALGIGIWQSDGGGTGPSSGPSSVPSSTDATATSGRPYWLPAVPRAVNEEARFGVRVESPADNSHVAGRCLVVSGVSSTVPAGRTLVLALANTDGPPSAPYFYTMVKDWRDPAALKRWSAVASLGAAPDQTYNVAVLTGDVATMDQALKAHSLLNSGYDIPSLELVAFLAITQSSQVGDSC